MFSDDFIRSFIDRFDPNMDRYAIGRPREGNPAKYEYIKQLAAGTAEPLTFDVIRQHFEGSLTIGVYPIRNDNTTRWFAIDFDAPKDVPKEERFDIVLKAARQQQKHFFANGLFTYLERSRSGTGVHVWGFLRDPMPAQMVRQAVMPLLLAEHSALIDHGKCYPADPEKSTNHTLICVPYGGAWVPDGCTMFLRNDTGAPWPVEEFLVDVKVNGNEAVERIAAKAPKVRPTKAPAAAAGSRSGYLQNTTIGADGRPDRLYETGIMKMVSPLGCQFMHQAVRALGQEPGTRPINEPEWYAFLGQLSAFEHGREAAHVLSALDPRYNPRQTDEKYDHACKSPPNGCQSIHEKFPQWACKSCPMTAPYRIAEKSLVELSTSSAGVIESGRYTEDVARIQRRNSGVELPGINPGIQGMERYMRLRNTELVAIGAQPSIGKTALFVDMACNIGASGVEVYAFSAESSREVIHDRLIAHESRIDSRALRGERAVPLSREEYIEIDIAIESLKKLPIYENYSATRPEDMLRLIERDRIARGAPWHSPYVTLFDYLQFGLEVEAGEAGEFRAINRRLDELKTLRRVTQRNVTFFSQLVRDSEGKKEPAINWWRGSGKIEAIIDLGLILTGERRDGPAAPREITLVKQKEGDVGIRVEYVLHQAICRWEPRGVVEARAPEPDPIFNTWTQS